MNKSRNEKSGKLAKVFTKSVFRKALQVSIDIMIEPFMNNSIPFAIVSAKFQRVPPIFIKHTIFKAHQFCPEVEPTM